MVAFYQEKIFKRFKEREEFQQMVKQLKIHKSIVIFKINVDWKVSESNEVISDFDFSTELFEGHQERLRRKYKQF